MGALFGVVGAAPEAEVRAMGRRLAHRGGHCALARHGDGLVLGAIQDKPGASIFQSGDLSIVCDATLYNAAALLSRLAQCGARLGSDAPAPIILSLYQAFGAAGIEAIDGDFAFALIDRQRGEVIFGRDFFGCAPLYYTLLRPAGIAFASEYKALLALSAVRAEPDRDMVQHLQYAKRLPPGRTLLTDVRAVLPGGTTHMGREGRELARHPFLPLKVDATVVAEKDAVELVRGGLTEAVRRRSADLERIGVALSGGIDSIALAFLLRQCHPDREIHTFTAGYGPDDPEIATAARAAKQIRSVHHEVITPPGLLKSGLRDLVWHQEDPYSRSEALQLFEVGRAARGHVKVLFSAQGADGLFGGMPKYKLLWLMKWLPPFRKGLAEFYNLTQLGLKPKTLVGKALSWARFRGGVPDAPLVKGVRSIPGPIQLPPMSREFINIVMAGGFQAGVGQDLQKFERGFAAWGVAYRSPFYDLSFVRSAYTITDRLKIRRGTQKYILRRALAELVPGEFLRLPKFPQRMRYDVEFSDTLDQIASSVLSKEAVERRGLFEPESIESLRARPRGRAYSAEAAMHLWTAVLTELWAQEFLDKRGGGLVPGAEGPQGSLSEGNPPGQPVPGHL